MDKIASIKTALRKALDKRAGQAVSISRPSADSAEMTLGSVGFVVTFSDHDDDGDPATDEQHDQIFEALEGIVSEHNAA
jgi:hypothetical protein